MKINEIERLDHWDMYANYNIRSYGFWITWCPFRKKKNKVKHENI